MSENENPLKTKKTKAPKLTREQRLAQSLRANLRRRKDVTRKKKNTG